ncbi:MAG: hypothetical protein JWM51_1492 [Microbacteriaceae bacterium]|jgi:hypothetical protein|nr:hypothetical protein [Microbacteriaceae bacterium]
MWTSIRRSHARRAPRWQGMGVALAFLACAGLAACTATETPSHAPTAGADSTASWPSSGEVDPGTYIVTDLTVPFEITLPEGWESVGWGAFKEVAGEWGVAVSFQSVGHVSERPVLIPTNGCAWRDAMVEVEASRKAYVAAMTAQSAMVTTSPVEVTVGDYTGVEFDRSVEDGVDIASCDHALICIWSERRDACAHGLLAVSTRGTERVFDLNGELAVLAVAEFVPVDPALRREARAVFDSILFAPRK